MIAHIKKQINEEEIQTLKEHSEETAYYARESLKNTNFEDMAYCAGLLHDMGKAKEEYETYLKMAVEGKDVKRGSVNHTFAAVIYLLEKWHKMQEEKMILSEILAYATGAHHGLFDCIDLRGKSGFEHRIQYDKNAIFYNESKSNYFEEVVTEKEYEKLFDKAAVEFNQFIKCLKVECSNRDTFCFTIGLLCRLILSAVIYGDRKSTIEFEYENIPHNIISWDKEIEFFENKIKDFKRDTELNIVRSEISEMCAKASERPTGIYKLNVPTGGGKTLSSFRYALYHAKKYNKSRIIYVIPYLSIIDQNAEVLKKHLYDEKLVLEHHSDFVHEEVNDSSELDEYDFLCTTWDSPVIITTMVQLLDILFSGKTSAVARMQALSNSIIIFDEIQSIPRKCIYMFNMAVNFLSRYCNTTIVLSSATQPSFGNVAFPINYSEKADIVTLTAEQKKVFKRADIINLVNNYGYSDEEACECIEKIAQKTPSLLLICNTKKEALEFYKYFENKEEYCVYHLSTSMFKAHRKRVLKEICNLLTLIQRGETKQKIICVSTQLVEAGIDFSFASVVRVLAGMDNLSQAAGRCNRSNEYDQVGKVYLIKLKNEDVSKLVDIEYAQKSSISVLESKVVENNELIENKGIALFYERLFIEYEGMDRENRKLLGYDLTKKDKDSKKTQLSSKENIKKTFTQLLSGYNTVDKQKEFRLNYPFETLGKIFSVFDEATVNVIVECEENEELIDKLKDINRVINSDEAIRQIKPVIEKLQDYSVNLFDYQIKKLQENGMLNQMFDGRILILNENSYNKKYGVDFD